MNPTFKTFLFTEHPLSYEGKELQSHWIYRRFEILGNAIVAFEGPANVTVENMVDLVDVKKNAPIFSPRMLHFLGEWFVDSLELGIFWQHLFVCEVYESLLERNIRALHRRGNDIYFENRKLSVSIATRSRVSVLMHLGLNIETEGTPLPTSGLKELGIEPFSFASGVFEKFQRDEKVWQAARAKVRATC